MKAVICDFMKRLSLLIGLVIIVILIPSAEVLSQNIHLPYYNSFESELDTVGWKFVKQGVLSPSEWCWGSAVSREGEKSLYISADEGVSASYTEHSNGYNVVVYKKFSLPAGRYDLAFDCLVGGELAEDGSVRDGLKVAWIPESFKEPTAGFGGVFPNYALLYSFKSSDGRNEFANTGWENITGTVDVSATESGYYLAFVWKTNGGSAVSNPGACIDNIQLALQREGECAERPADISVSLSATDGNGIISWKGSAVKYDLMYRQTNVSGEGYVGEATGLTSASYSIAINSIPEGIYSVFVRSICGADTSIWSVAENVFLYDVSSHCLDYLNFDAQGVECTYGDFSNPYRTVGVRNYGYESKNSIHTIHYRQDEYDPRTNYQLKTVPDGAMASVRISNWTELQTVSGSITYTYTVTDDADVLKLQYAAVLQYESYHSENDQTRIIVEILDAESDTLVSTCTYSNFNAKSVDNDKVRGWNRIEAGELPAGTVELDNPILWCDWTVIGMNLAEYVGRTFKIRLTLKPCGANYHFAYAYFTLDCDKGEIEGVSCGEHPDTLSVPEGFIYEWYKTHDETRTVVCDKNFLEIMPDDTSSYSVDLIFPENDNCYFTLNASALPKEPIAKVSYTIDYSDCHSVVRLDNQTQVFGFWEGDTIETFEKCKAHAWDLGRYGTSNEYAPVINVPAEGDTFEISLMTSIDSDWKCADMKEFLIAVPSIVQDTTVVKYEICDGASVIHDGQEYSESGRIELHYSNSETGCDSVVVLEISKIATDTVFDSDIVCTDELPVVFHGDSLMTTGEYKYVVKSSIGCDSIVYVFDLTVNQALVADLSSDNVEVCADYGTFSVPFTLYEGVATDYRIVYGEVAHDNLFADSDVMPIDGDNEVIVELPDDVRPGNYRADIMLFGGECDSVVLPLTIKVYYPSTVIAQRWNDVLALKNAEYNGGYEFSSYQWYENGTQLHGETRPILYLPDSMDYFAEYSMLLTRADDGVTTFTCPVVPQKYADADIEVFPTVVFSGGFVEVVSGQKVSARLYNISGQLVDSYDIMPGRSMLRMPVNDGMYVLSVICPDCMSENIKIIVRR